MIDVETLERAVQDVLTKRGYIDIPSGLTHDEWAAGTISDGAKELARDIFSYLPEQYEDGWDG